MVLLLTHSILYVFNVPHKVHASLHMSLIRIKFLLGTLSTIEFELEICSILLKNVLTKSFFYLMTIGISWEVSRAKKRATICIVSTIDDMSKWKKACIKCWVIVLNSPFVCSVSIRSI